MYNLMEKKLILYKGKFFFWDKVLIYLSDLFLWKVVELFYIILIIIMNVLCI